MSVLLEREIGKKALLMGNEALVRGAYEAGLDYASCYPGTPSSPPTSKWRWKPLRARPWAA